MSDLNTKTALVTGGSSGIGRAIAQRLARDGAVVGVHYGHNEEAAKETLASIEQTGGSGFLVHAEFGADGDVDALFAGLETGLAGRPLTILVNNAGILQFDPFDQVSADDFDRMYAINVRAPFFITQRALGLMADGGRIINISSAVTRIAGPFVPYALNKGAIEVFGRTLAQALGPRGITVNSVAPGVVDTEMGAWARSSAEIESAVTSSIALGRLGQPGDVADVVSFLASPDARWITGVVVDASGGQWLGPAQS